MPQYVPPPLTLDDVLRVSWFGRLHSQRIMWVLHCRPAVIFEPVYLAAMATFAEALSTDMAAVAGKFGAIRELQSNEFTWEYVQCQRIVPTREIYFRETINAAGADAAQSPTPNIALSVTLRTAFADPHGIGRTQLAGMPVNKLNDGLWDGVLVDNVVSLMDVAMTEEFEDIASGNNYQWGVFATYAVTTEINDIINVVGHNQARTMHRRTVGLGE